MKRNSNEYRKERDLAVRTLLSIGIDLDQQGTYDCRPTKKRYSVFRGYVTAVWDDSHFKKIPFGTFQVVG